MSTEKGKNPIKSNGLRAVIFLCVLALVFMACVSVFDFADAEHSNVVMEEFYAQEENTVDCVYFGTSATQRGWNVPLAYHDYGVASYSMATASQPFMLTRFLMEEAEKTQNPELFIIELRCVAKSPDDLYDAGARRIIDNVKISKNKIDMIRAYTAYARQGDNAADTTGMSYYLPFLQYHSLWNPSKQPHYGKADYYKGYAIEPKVSFKVTEIFPMEYTEKKVPLAEATEEEMKSLLDYCDSIDTKVLFVISPYEASEQGMGKINSAKEMAEARGYEVLNCLTWEKMKEIGVEPETCYYNREHLNVYGAELYTAYLSEYIQKNYGIKDRRGMDGYDTWEKEYKRLMKNFKGEYAEQYDTMLDEVEKGAE